MNVLQLLRRHPARRRDGVRPDSRHRTRRIRTCPSWWPPGHGLGYEHGFTHQVIDLVNAIGAGGTARPTFADGLHVQRVLAAVESSSADDSRWQSIPSDG